jgi:hypothetical protein
LREKLNLDNDDSGVFEVCFDYGSNLLGQREEI